MTPDAAELEKWRQMALEIAAELDDPCGEPGCRDCAVRASWRSLASFLEQMEGLAGREVGRLEGWISASEWQDLTTGHTYAQVWPKQPSYEKGEPGYHATVIIRPTPTTAPVEVDEGECEHEQLNPPLSRCPDCGFHIRDSRVDEERSKT